MRWKDCCSSSSDLLLRPFWLGCWSGTGFRYGFEGRHDVTRARVEETAAARENPERENPVRRARVVMGIQGSGQDGEGRPSVL